MKEQVLFEICKKTDEFCKDLDISDQNQFNDIWERKFAEFLILECISLIKPLSDKTKSKTTIQLLKNINDNIKDHFGLLNK